MLLKLLLLLAKLLTNISFIQMKDYKIKWCDSNNLVQVDSTGSKINTVPVGSKYLSIIKIDKMMYFCASCLHVSSYPGSGEADCKINTAPSPYLSFFSSSWLMLTSCPEASWDFLVMVSNSASTRIFSLARTSDFFSTERSLPSSAGGK